MAKNELYKARKMVTAELLDLLQKRSPKIQMSDTGGGCTWFDMYTDHGVYGITTPEGDEAPSTTKESVLVCLHNEDYEWEGKGKEYDSIVDFFSEFDINNQKDFFAFNVNS